MKVHLATLLMGTLLVGSSACLRGTPREMAAPVETLPWIASPVACEWTTAPSSIPAPCLDRNQPSEDPTSELEELLRLKSELDAIVQLQSPKQCSMGPLDKGLSDSQKALVEPWEAWRCHSISSLPEELRENSDHRKAIEAHYAAAIRDIVASEVLDVGRQILDFEGPRIQLTLAYTAARQAADQLERDLLSCFPFTGSQPMPTQVWQSWKEQAIQALPENLRENSDHRKAIDDQFRAAMQGLLAPEEFEVLNSHDFQVDLINRPPVGGWDIGGVGFTDIDDRWEVMEFGVEVEVYLLRVSGGEESFLEADE